MFIHSKLLTEQLKFVTSGTMKPASPEIYSTVLIEYDKDKNSITFRSFNSFCHVRTIIGTCEARSIRSDSSNHKMALNAGKLLSAMSKLNDQIFIHFDFIRLKVKVKSKKSKVEDVCMDGSNFIDIPDIESVMTEIPVPEFIKIGLQRMMFIPDSRSFDDMARGIFMGKKNGVFEMFATDRQTLCKSTDKENMAIDLDGKGAILPMQSINMIHSMLSTPKQTFAAAITADQVALATRRDMIVSTSLNAKTPPYETLIHNFLVTKEYIVAKVNRVEFLNATEFVGHYADDSFNQMIMVANQGRLQLQAGEMTGGGRLGEGSYRGEIEIEYSGGKEGQAMNGLVHIPKMVKALKAIESESVMLLLSTKMPRADAICIQPEGSKIDTLYFIAMMRPDEVPIQVDDVEETEDPNAGINADEFAV